jgi:hypothetical protein
MEGVLVLVIRTVDYGEKLGGPIYVTAYSVSYY